MWLRWQAILGVVVASFLVSSCLGTDASTPDSRSQGDVHDVRELEVDLKGTAVDFSLDSAPRKDEQEADAVQETGSVFYVEDFEAQGDFKEATPQILKEAVEDCIIEGNCWIESERWLEVGAMNSHTQGYTLAPQFGEAEISSKTSYTGERAARIVSYELPTEYSELFVCAAHYVRNQSDVKAGVYEVGAWFYVPEGREPVVIIGMENHPSWLVQYFAYAAIDARDGSVLVPDAMGWTKVGQVAFEHNTWVKLWVTLDTTSTDSFTFGYKSSSEEKEFQGKLWVGYNNQAYKGHSAFNFYAGMVVIGDRGTQEVYVDDFYAKRELHTVEWVLLKKEGFEYEATFDYPSNWQDKSSHPEYEWHLEKPGQHAETSTDVSLSGQRSAKITSKLESGKKLAMSALVLPDYTYWSDPLKKMVVHFYLPEGQFKEDAYILIDIDLYDWDRKKWHIGFVGFNRAGTVVYGNGYAPGPRHGKNAEYIFVDTGFVLKTDRWYRAELQVDFSRFDTSDALSLKIYNQADGEMICSTTLPLTFWTDNMLYEWSWAGYYFGVLSFSKYYSAVAYFDEVELYVGQIH